VLPTSNYNLSVAREVGLRLGRRIFFSRAALQHAQSSQAIQIQIANIGTVHILNQRSPEQNRISRLPVMSVLHSSFLRPPLASNRGSAQYQRLLLNL